jgi:hypothetical protein
MIEYFQCKNGEAVILDLKGKRWAVIFFGKEKQYPELFETEKEARVYLNALINKE